MNILCGHPLRPSNSAQPGWNNGVLAVADKPSVLWCQGCAAYDRANPPATVTNQATIQANIQTHLAQIEAWLTANPNGAVLTAAQTKFVAQTLVGVARLLLGLTSTVGGAT